MLRILFVFSNKQEKLVEGITRWKRNFNSNRYAKREVSQVNPFPAPRARDFVAQTQTWDSPAKPKRGSPLGFLLPAVGRCPAGMSSRKEQQEGAASLSRGCPAASPSQGCPAASPSQGDEQQLGCAGSLRCFGPTALAKGGCFTLGGVLWDSLPCF